MLFRIFQTATVLPTQMAGQDDTLIAGRLPFHITGSGSKNSLVSGLTYGQMNGLAGDFYWTYDPFSNGKNEQDRSTFCASVQHTR